MKKLWLTLAFCSLSAYHPGPYIDSREGLYVNDLTCGVCNSKFGLNHETDYWYLYNPCVMPGEIINGYRPSWQYVEKNSNYIRNRDRHIVYTQKQWFVNPRKWCP